MKKYFLTFILAFFSIILISCGSGSSGGGSSGGNANPSNNNNTNPTVTMVSPANESSGFTQSPNIVLQFNETVENVESSVAVYESSLGTSPIKIRKPALGAANRYTFSAESTLKPLTKYYVVVGNKVTNLAGNAINQTTFSFTTGDFITTTATMVDPVNNQTGVSTTPTINLQFSELMQNVESNVSLYENSIYMGSPIPITEVTLGSDNRYSFSPLSALKANTTYYVKVNSNTMSVSGNATSMQTFTFITK